MKEKLREEGTCEVEIWDRLGKGDPVRWKLGKTESLRGKLGKGGHVRWKWGKGGTCEVETGQRFGKGDPVRWKLRKGECVREKSPEEIPEGSEVLWRSLERKMSQFWVWSRS